MMDDYILQYYQQIQDGSIIAGKWIKMLYQRIIDGIESGEYVYDLKKAHKAIKFIERYCRHNKGKLAPGFIKLSLWQKAAVSCIYGIVDQDGKRIFKEVFFLIGRKCGKALSLDTEVATPNGFVPMRDIHAGDQVFGQDGKPSVVIAESEIFNKPMYAVTFEDGEVIKASADHLWTVQARKMRERFGNEKKQLLTFHGKKIRENRTADYTTEELYKDYMHVRKDGKGVDYKYRVPMCKPVEYEEKDLPLDPYTLGVWLGDGSRGSTEITCCDNDLPEMLRHLTDSGHKCKVLTPKLRTKKITLDSTGIIGGNKPGCNPTRTALRQLGVFTCKKIPDLYLHSSIKQRWELLRGLMDTDGTCGKNGQCEFSQKSEDFIDQFRELLSSLGIKSSKQQKRIKCNGKICEAYVVRFFASQENPCFKLERKKLRLKEKLAPRMDFKSITKIERIPDEPSKCIAIDNDTHLYLVGRSFTATHNTLLAAAIIAYEAYIDGEYGSEIYCVAPKLDQSELVYSAFKFTADNSPALASRIKPRKNDLYIRDSNTFVKKIAFSEKKADGYNPMLTVCDEMSSWPGARGLKQYEVMTSGTTARDEPLTVSISSSGYVNDGIFDELVKRSTRFLLGDSKEKRLLPFLYMIDDVSKWNDISELHKSLPGLGVSVSVQTILDEIDIAEGSLSKKTEFITKYCNIKQNSSAAWLSTETVKRCIGDPISLESLRHSYAVGGLDLSQTVDLTSACVIVQKNDILHVISHFWLPSEKLDEAEARDSLPYRQYIQRGILSLSGENFVNYHDCFDWFQMLVQKYEILPLCVGYDRYSAQYLIQDMKQAGYKVDDVYQGFNLSPVIQEAEGLMRDGRINIGDNDLLKIHLLDSALKRDIESNKSRLIKLRETGHIDGTAALLDALCVRQKWWPEIGAQLENKR